MKEQQNIPLIIDFSKELQVKVRTDTSSQGRTGIRGKTVWDWLQLLLVPLLLAGIGYWFTASQHDSEQRIADANRLADIARQVDQQREAALQAYLDRMSDLLLGNNTGKDSLSLASALSTDEVSQVAQAQTFTVLRNLDGQRKGIVLEFLYDAKLLGYPYPEDSNAIFKPPILTLGLADLNMMILTNTALPGVVLSYTHLRNADLAGTSFRHANLTGADLEGADLAGTDLFSSGLPMADMKGANLTGANLDQATLCEANLKGAIGVTKAQLLNEAFALQGATLPDGSKVPGQC